jgi:predicted dehydrogenase
MEPIRTGVIGLGRMGKQHCRIYSNLRESQLTGIYDSDPHTAYQVSQLYEIPACHTLDDLLADVEAVSIVTPTPTHLQIIQKCVKHNIHFLVEKPVIDSMQQAESLLKATNQSQLTCQVGHIERFNPTYVELRHVLENRRVFAINFQRLSPYRVSNKDVDVVLDLMVHDLDLCNDLMGCEPVAVNALGINPFSETLDHVEAQLSYSTGQVITLTASRITEQKVRMVQVTAEDAYIEADFLNKSIFIHRGSTGEYTSNTSHQVKYHQESLVERIMVPSAEPLALEIRHFIQCIRQGTTPDVPLSAGLKALELAEHIRRQVRVQ